MTLIEAAEEKIDLTFELARKAFLNNGDANLRASCIAAMAECCKAAAILAGPAVKLEIDLSDKLIEALENAK